jgi:ubiquinone/menaquinone biosynthesis C-methylase UbiE
LSNGSWEKIYVEQGRVQIEVLDTVIQAAELFSKNKLSKILDLGCGTGRHTYYLADRGFNVHACDISETGLNITKKLINDAKFENVDYSIQDMYSMTFEEESFEGVLCIWVQGHGMKEQIQKGINEIHRILIKGGIVVTDFITTDDPTYGIGDEIAPNTFVGGRPGEEDIPHYYTTRNELKVMFKAFSEVKIKDKVYRFNDLDGNEHEIIALLVEARK